MKLTVFNGSPKPGANNTQILVDSLVEGMKSVEDQDVAVHKLNRLDSITRAAELFEQAETVLIAFPLYSYAMPGDVKQFFEALEPFKGKCGGKKLGFLVQYGFQEAVHARPLEKYLVKLAAMLGCSYMGTIIKGGCDALSRSPRKQFRAIYEGMEAIGKTLAGTHAFDAQQLRDYSRPETAKKQSVWLMKIVVKLLNHLYWGRMLRKNVISVRESFAQPYV